MQTKPFGFFFPFPAAWCPTLSVVRLSGALVGLLGATSDVLSEPRARAPFQELTFQGQEMRP